MINDNIHHFRAKADEFRKSGKFSDAGKYYEKAAFAAREKKPEVVMLWQKAAQAYDKARESEAAVRCYLEASRFLRKTQKADCILAGWRIYVLAIAGYQWDCCFEWRGDDHHDDDHELNQQLIRECSTKAKTLLRQALEVEGVDKEKIIRLAVRECTKRKKEGGWGEGACWNIVTAVTGREKGFFNA